MRRPAKDDAGVVLLLVDDYLAPRQPVRSGRRGKGDEDQLPPDPADDRDGDETGADHEGGH
jgi:hypothetical protein